MTGTITRKDIKSFLDCKLFTDYAETYFKGVQPSIYQTGYYSAPSMNWAYFVGITSIKRTGQDALDFGEIATFEVVTQFGEVKAARMITIPTN